MCAVDQPFSLRARAFARSQTLHVVNVDPERDRLELIEGLPRAALRGATSERSFRLTVQNGTVSAPSIASSRGRS